MRRSLGLTTVVMSAAFVVAASPSANAVVPLPQSTTVEGVSVTAIQQNLNAAGATVEVTGVWDAAAEDAWLWFTTKFTLIPTTNVTPTKLARLQTVADKADIPRSCRSEGYVICADRHLRVIRLMRNGRQIDSADAAFGIGRYATRPGNHRVNSKTRFLISDLSGTPMPYSLFFSGGQAIHYSQAFSRRGYEVGTLGCVAVGDRAFAKRLYQMSPVGRKVVVH
jgi:L,D-transpeptidase catalytic domain